MRHVERSFGRGPVAVPVIRDVSFDIARNEFVAIMGPSGSGKSTLMNILGLLDRPTKGTVSLADQDVGLLTDDGMARLRGRSIGFVFQSYNLLARSTAVENVGLPLLYLDRHAGTRHERAMRSLEAVGLGAKAGSLPSQLSGGEQQRVALARAFVLKPPIVLADEPTGNLDSVNGQQVLRLLLDLNREEGTTLVLVTHDPAVAALAHRRITLKDGLVIADDDAVTSSLDEPVGGFAPHSDTLPSAGQVR